MNVTPRIVIQSADPVVDLDGVGFGYSANPVFTDVQLSFKAGEMVGIIGPNGAGKTTLLRLMMGLITPQQGRIRLRGCLLSDYSRRELAQAISLVPQDTQIGYAFSAMDIVAMGRNPHLGRFQPLTSQDEAIVIEAMRQTGVLKLADRTIHTLSGGERQRVLIARAIAQNTPIVLFDEATANLDLCHQLEVMETAHRLAKKGCLVIAAIHDLVMASRYCDRLVLLAKGCVKADGPPNEVLTEPNLLSYFSIIASIRPNSDLTRGLSITPLAGVTPAA